MGKAPVIGLDIGTFAVRAVELTPGSGKPTVTRLGQVTLPAGAVVDGEVVDVHAVAGALTRLWTEAGFKSRSVAIAVTGPRVIIRQAKTAAMSEEDMRAGLRYQAQELLPIPVDDTHLDFCILDREDAEPEGEPMMNVLLAAAQHDVVAGHLAALEVAGLTPASVDVLPLALLRAFPDATSPEGGPEGGQPGGPATEAVVSVGAGLTTVVVREAGVPRFVRVLAVGGDDITSAIEADLGCDMDYAEHLKRQAAQQQVQAGAGSASGSVATLSRATALLAEHVRPLVEEIRGSFDYYLAQSHVDQIDRIVLTGGGVNTWGLVSSLQGSLSPNVVVADPFEAVALDVSGLSQEDVRRATPFMAGAVGLALGVLPGPGAIAINLLPEELLIARKRRRQTVGVGAGVACFAVMLGGVWAVQHQQVVATENAAIDAETQVNLLQTKLASLADVSKSQADLKARRQAVGTVLTNDVDHQRLIQQITASMPDDVWLTSFSVQQGNKTTPGKVTFGASGLSQDAVVRWVRQLNTLPSITNLWVPNSTKAGDGGEIVTFMSSADLTPAANSNRAANFSGKAR